MQTTPKLIKAVSDNKLLQQSINDLVQWTDKWLLKFNNDKCKILHLGKNNPKYKYFIKQGDQTTELLETVSEKDLGVFIDPYLRPILYKTRLFFFNLDSRIYFKVETKSHFSKYLGIQTDRLQFESLLLAI